LILGAVMRHLHAGLSIPDFPLAFHRLIPPMTDERVAIHFAHRVGAVVVTLLAVPLVTMILTSTRRNALLTRAAMGLLCALVLQITLGATVIIWLPGDPVIKSLHVVNGALVLAEALLLALRASRLNTAAQPESQNWEYQEAHA
jgi:cytochrome c oxidase assembly protein subunit 15